VAKLFWWLLRFAPLRGTDIDVPIAANVLLLLGQSWESARRGASRRPTLFMYSKFSRTAGGLWAMSSTWHYNIGMPITDTRDCFDLVMGH
jgi:hypothetical protein